MPKSSILDPFYRREEIMRRLVLMVATFAVLLSQGFLKAEEDAGQADLDKAIETKLDAEDLQSLQSVVRLCESALEKGLSDGDKAFAEKLLASTLAQRGVVMGQAAMSGRPTGVDPNLLRKMAILDLERAVKFDERLLNAQTTLAKLYALVKEDRPKALATIDKVLGLEEPKESDLLLLRANLQDSPEKQLEDLDKAHELFPDDPQPLRARGAWRLTQEKFDEALTDFDAAIELDAEDANSHQGRAMALSGLKRYDEAKAAYTRAAELAPRSAEPYLRRAQVHLAVQDLEKAIDDLTKAIEIDDDNLTALLLRSEAYILSNKIDEALADVNRALKVAPNHPALLQTRARAYMGQRKWDAAIDDLERIRKAAPEDIATHIRLAAAYVGRKDNEGAIRVLTEALAIDLKNQQGRPDRGDILRTRADAYLGLGKQKEAIADYEEALKIRPDDSGILNNLAWVLSTSPNDELRNGERSVKLATEACEKTEYKEAHILSTLAAAYAETGDFETAKKWSKQSLELAQGAMKANLEKELKSYEKNEKWREAVSPGVDDEENAPEEKKTEEANSESKPAET